MSFSRPTDRSAEYLGSRNPVIVPDVNMISVFRGLNLHERLTEGELSDDLNFSSDEYPALGVIRERKYAEFYKDGERVQPYIAGNVVDACQVDGNVALITDGGRVYYKGLCFPYADAGIARQIVPFNRGFFVSPTGLYVNDISGSTVKVTSAEMARIYVETAFTLGVPTGPEDMGVVVGDDVPDDHETYWFSTGADEDYPEGLYQYLGGSWQTVTPYGYRIEMPEYNISQLHEGGRVEIVLSGTVVGREFSEELHAAQILKVGVNGNNGYIIVNTIPERYYYSAYRDMHCSVLRRFPVLDYVVVHNNRIWGCRYGTADNGEFVNEIYASALGDPLTWYRLDDIEDAAFVSSVGEPGVWTGAAVVGGNVVFFKENSMFTVYGDYPSEYRIVRTECDGIRDGSFRSAVSAGGYLYYLSGRGIMRLASDSLPVLISDAVRGERFTDCFAATDGNKLYFDVQNGDTREMYVYDIGLNIWHRERRFNEYTTAFVMNRPSVASFGSEPGELFPIFTRRTTEPVDPLPAELEGTGMEALHGALINTCAQIAWFGSLPDASINAALIYSESIPVYGTGGTYSLGDVVAWGGAIYYALRDDPSTTDDLALALPVLFGRQTVFGQRYFVDIAGDERRFSLPWRLTTEEETEFEENDVHIYTDGRERFYMETGDIGLNSPDVKRVKSVDIRAKVHGGGSLNFSVMYDADGIWHDLKASRTAGFGSVRFSGDLSRCETFRIRAEGWGDVTIFSITYSTEPGGNR